MTAIATAAPTFELNGSEIEMYVDGIYAGHLNTVSEGSGIFRVEKVEIENEFRGMGLYRQLLVATFGLKKCDIIRSFERNYLSNPIYCAWTGEDIDGDKIVWIQCFGGKLEFTVDEE